MAIVVDIGREWNGQCLFQYDLHAWTELEAIGTLMQDSNRH